VTENGMERAEKAVEALVYGTVGLALYVRDTAPSFIKLFVARGKNELGHQGKSVSDQLGQVRSLGDQLGQVRSLGDFAAQGAPQVLKVVSDQVAWLRERAEDVIAGLGAQPGEPASPPPYSPAPAPAPTSSPAPGPTAEATANVPPTSWRSGAAPSATDATEATADGAGGLAITDYDELSASQVVDRLEGLPRHELEAIRDYERAHRARNTILGKIEQLTR
jgi:hypothetical protein